MGLISAYDAETGDLVWRFYTVPGDPAQPFESPILAETAKTWHGEWWKLGGGGTVWEGLSYDPELNLIYFGVGNGLEWDQGQRSASQGDNWFLSSIVAVNADTGEYAWHFQATPGEEWDFDAVQQLILADVTIDGTRRQVLMQANKNGFFYVLDRAMQKMKAGSLPELGRMADKLKLVPDKPQSSSAVRFARRAFPRADQRSAPPPSAARWEPVTRMACKFRFR